MEMISLLLFAGVFITAARFSLHILYSTLTRLSGLNLSQPRPSGLGSQFQDTEFSYGPGRQGRI